MIFSSLHSRWPCLFPYIVRNRAVPLTCWYLAPVWTTWREKPCCFRELWDSGSAGENRKSKVKVRDKRAAWVSARVFNVEVRNHRKPLVETLFY